MSTEVAPVRTYLLVWVGLSTLLAITLACAYIPMRELNIVVNMGVSIAKTLLVMLFFMHLRRAGPLLRIFSSIGFVWLLMLLMLSLSDYLSRIPISSPW